MIAVLGPEGQTIGKGIAECGSQELARMLDTRGPQKGILVRRENFLLLAKASAADV